MNTKAAGRERVLVVGNGMVGHRFCERLHELDASGRYEVVVLAEEPRPAYDRVHLSEYFNGRGVEALALTSEEWYGQRGIDLYLGDPVVSIDTAGRFVRTAAGRGLGFDHLVFATGSTPFVPPIPGTGLEGVFVYRTVEDLDAIRTWAEGAERAAVIGGGLLGLEAAKAMLDMSLETHVVEFAERLMPRQLDDRGGAVLACAIEALGVQIHLGARTEAILGEGRVAGLRLSGAEPLDVDMVIVSAGIRPRDELAREAGIAVGERGGICIDDTLTTSIPGVYAIGECALHRELVYGLVAPGYEMAETLARRLTDQSEAAFEGADLSTRLKLLGVDVASFGEAFPDRQANPGIRDLVFHDSHRGVYQKLLIDEGKDRLIGGILVGDVEPFGILTDAVRRSVPLPERPESWLFGGLAGEGDGAGMALDDAAQVCSCNDVTVGAVREAIAEGELESVSSIKACTRAGTGCGGCVPQLAKILEQELAEAGRSVSQHLCEHFAYTRQELFWIVKLGRIDRFDALLESHGQGDGCEVCRPAIASILASTWSDLVLDHASIQDTNDRFLANIQRGGTYSVIPRVPGGEITPEKLMVIAEVARKYDLSCKITGGQRIDLLGARIDQLPSIWEELVQAGFESGHAYGKAMRTVKSCVGSTWCRYGVQDSTGFAIRVEERYRGIRAPHKLKSAVSGCIRECAEAQSKDFGIIATENGWNVYLCGNGGSNPRHADLVATDLSDDEAIRLIDRFLMFYIQTAKPLQRTARWLEELDGGIAYLKSVIIDDALGICEQLEADMDELVGRYQCEWRSVVEDETRRAEFRHFIDSKEADPRIRFERERGQRKPVDWPSPEPLEMRSDAPSETEADWVHVGRASEVPRDGGRAFGYAGTQIAVFNFTRRGEWYATQNSCPHRKDMVLARGMLGTQGEEPKVACPMHKKTFSLLSGKGLADPVYAVRTFPVEIRDGEIYVKLPPADVLEADPGCMGRGA